MVFYVEVRIFFEDNQSETDFHHHFTKLMMAFQKGKERIQCSYSNKDHHHLEVSFVKVLPDEAAIRIWSQLITTEILDLLGNARAQIAPKGIRIAQIVDNHQAAQRSLVDGKTDSDLAPGDEIILSNAKVFQLQQQGSFYEALPIAHRTAWLALSYSAESYCPGTMEALLNLAGAHFVIRNYDAADLLFENTLTILSAIKNEGLSVIPANWYKSAAHLKGYGTTISVINSDGSTQESDILPASKSREFGSILFAAENNPTYSDHLSNYALFYQMINNYAVAEQLFLRVIDSDRNLGRRRELAISLGHLATLYQEMGKLSAAEPLLTEALGLKLETVGETHPSYANTLTRLSQIYRLLLNSEKAERFARKSLRIRQRSLGENHPLVAHGLCDLGLQLSGNVEKLDEAEQCLKKAIDIQRRFLGENDSDLALSLNNLARVCIRRGQYADAEELLEEAAAIWRVTCGERHPIYTVAINSLAVLHMKKGNYTVAEELIRQALATRQFVHGEKHPSTAIIMSNLAHLYTVTNRISEAFTLLKQNTVIQDNILEQVFPVLSEDDRLNYLKITYEALSSFLSFVFEYLPQNRNATGAAVSLVLRRKGISAEALAVQHNTVLSGRYPDLEPKLRQIENLRAQIGQRILWGPKVTNSEIHQQTIATLNNRKETLEKELALQIPEMNLKRQILKSDWRAIAHALPQDSALVEFVRYTPIDFKAILAPDGAQKLPRYLAFILRSREPNELHALDLGDAQKIDRLIDDFRFLLENSDLKQAKPMHEEHALRKKIFDPLVDALCDCSHVFLSPDGDLNRLPFEVLPLDNDRRLIDEYQISYLSTGRDILRFGMAVGGRPSQPLIVADPDFDLGTESTPISQKFDSRDTFGTRAHPFSEQKKPFRQFSRLLAQLSSSGCFKRLEGSRTEGEQIAAMLQVSPLLGEAALETRVKSCQSPRILHIATHGFFLSDQANDFGMNMLHKELADLRAERRISLEKNAGLANPMLCSGLVLAGVNVWLKNAPLPTEAEDGILTAEDVMGMDLLNTQLVVLSACDTGLGAVQTGEGVFGLRRSFVVAGARSLVMSLWKVPDQQTQALMLDFYSRILSGQARAQALREAQLNLKKQFPNPKHWGGFIYQGDPSPLSQ